MSEMHGGGGQKGPAVDGGHAGLYNACSVDVLDELHPSWWRGRELRKTRLGAYKHSVNAEWRKESLCAASHDRAACRQQSPVWPCPASLQRAEVGSTIPGAQGGTALQQ